MKKMMLTLMAMVTMTISAQAMSYSAARNEALFLTDKMAYELNLSAAQFEAAYEINLDYMLSVADRGDILGIAWKNRNIDMSYILTAYQYERFLETEYFYRPLFWNAGISMRIYSRYTDRLHFYFDRPAVYVTYVGGHSWRDNGNKSWYKNRPIDKKNHMTVVSGRASSNHGTVSIGKHSVGNVKNTNHSVAHNKTKVVNNTTVINHNVNNNMKGGLNNNNIGVRNNNNNHSVNTRSGAIASVSKSNNTTSTGGHFGGRRK